MEPHLSLLQDFAVILVVGGIVSVLFRRLNQPVVLGYLLAGFIVGPHSPPFTLVSNEEVIREFADFGIVLLMFGLGLEFSLERLKKVGLVAVAGATVEIAVMIALGYFLGRAFGWTTMEAVFLGAALSISSTAIIVKVLQEMGRLDRESSRVMFGILVVEDFFAVALMTVLAGVGSTGQIDLGEVAALSFRLVLFTVVSFALGLHLFSRAIDLVARMQSKEVLMLVAIGAAFAMALFADRLGLSIAAGAFIIGAIAAEARHADQVHHLTEPVRDLFGMMFFVAMGMLIDLRVVSAYVIPVVLIVLAVITGKMIACYVGVFLSGYSKRTAFQVGAGMSQVGEFSMVISKIGHDTGATGAFMQPLMAIVSGITALTTPYLMRGSDGLASAIRKAVPSVIRLRSDDIEFWSNRIHTTIGENTLLAHTARHSLFITALNLFISGVFLLLGNVAVARIQTTTVALPLGRDALSFLIGGVVIALCLPSVVAIWRGVRGFVSAVVLRVAEQEQSPALLRRRVMMDTLPIATSVGVILLLMLEATPLALRLASLGQPVYLLPFGVLAAGLIWLAWGTLGRFHRRVESFVRLKERGRGAAAGQPDEDKATTILP